MRFHMNGGHVPKPPFKARAVGSNMSKPPTHPTTPSTLPCNLTQVVAGGSSAESNLFWALVYVPQGTTAGALNIATAGAGGSSAESNLFWALVYVPQGTTAGALNIATAGNSRQHVRTQPVCHELRRHRPYSRSYQDLLSYLSQPQRRRQDLSPHPSYS